MAENKVSKFGRVMRKYGYWTVLAASVVVLALVLSLTATFGRKAPEDDSSLVNTTPIEFLTPLAASTIVKDYSNSALQYSKTLKQWEAHKAIDFAAEDGADVYAVANGTVIEVSYTYLMGNTVKLDLGDELIVVYCSLANNVPVKVGDKVTKGSIIGKVGNTAKSEISDGPHLHLETWLKGVNVDPNLYLDLGDK